MPSITDHISVAIPLPVYDTYTYHVPDPLIPLVSQGKRVLVPFHGRKVTGYAMGPGAMLEGKKIKSILDVLDTFPLFPPSMIPFFNWISDYYMHPIGEVIKGALPGGINHMEVAEIAITENGEKALSDGFPTPLEHQVLTRLQRIPINIKRLNPMLKKDVPHGLIQTMARKGWISRKARVITGKIGPKTERFITLCPIPPNENQAKMTPAKKKIIHALVSQPEMSLKQLKSMVPSAPKQIKILQEMGYISISDKPVFRDPFGEPIRRDHHLTLTPDQQRVIQDIIGALDRGFTTHLLAGVTGSGKTEIYLQAAAAVLNRKNTVLVLVPEIALISQTERRFRARFGNKVAVLHSGLSKGERYDQWIRIIQGQTPIVIGARSAIFAPFSNIGLIVVDEEHDTSYKQEGGLRYHARDLAVLRARLHGCIALLGSATPSVQSCYNAVKGKFTPLTLAKRIENRPMPKIITVDLRKMKGKSGFQQFISPRLHSAMSKALDRGEQVLLFLNRRGYAGLPLCTACGETIRCAHCDITLTFHQRLNVYKCHYCGFKRRAVVICPRCQAPKIKHLGVGTERVESTVKSLFPSATVARMDRDTTVRKGSILKILKGVRKKAIDVLIGTQMVTKGHDFSNITLVGIICADFSLNFPDFRAGERTFQLLAQVAGRAGRGDVPGKVILQTYNPGHFSIQAAKAQDAHLFYMQEISFRKALHYPPFSRMVLLKIRGKDKGKVAALSESLKTACRRVKTSNPVFKAGIQVMGPIEAAIPKVADYYRYRILLKGETPGMIHRFLSHLRNSEKEMFTSPHVKVAIDVDPIFMM